MSPYFLVPMAVQALQVSKWTGAWAPSTSSLPFAAGVKPGAGVLVRWILPDGLSRGAVNRADKLTLPSIPDLYLVLRWTKGSSTGGAPKLRTWLLDAVTGAPYKAITNASSRPQLTAAGPVDANARPVSFTGAAAAPSWEDRSSWAAFAPDSTGRMSLLDDLTGLSSSEKTSAILSYQVIGWYSDASRSPLLAGASAEATGRSEFLRRSGWTIPWMDGADIVTVAQGQPEFAVGLCCHGSLVEVNLAKGGRGTPPTPSVALGESLAQAVPRLVLPDTNPLILQALMAHVPEKLDAVANTSEIAETVERSAYGRGEGTLDNPLRFVTLLAERPDAVARGLMDLRCPEATARALLRLDAMDLLNVLFKLLPTSSRSSRTALPAALLEFLDLDGHSGNSAVRDWETCITSLRTQRLTYVFPEERQIRDAVRGWATVRGRPLNELDLAVPGFDGLYAAPPVVVLDGAGRSLRHGYDHRYDGDKLRCRLGPRVGYPVKKIRIAGTDLQPASADTITSVNAVLPSGIDPDLKAVIAELVHETLLFDPSNAAWLSKQVTGLMPGLCEARQRAWWAGRDPEVDPDEAWAISEFDGLRPSLLAVSAWDVPWDPVFLEYRYTWKVGDTSTTYVGRGSLNHAAVRGLEGGLSRIADVPLDLLAEVTTRDLLSATLDGVKYKDQIPTAPNASDRFSRVGPVRDGKLKLVDLRILDGFGRVLEVSSRPEVDLPPRLTRTAAFDLPLPGNHLAVTLSSGGTLTRRRSWDSRASAQDRHDPRGKLVGWMVVDHIDHAVEFLDAKGQTLGQLREHARKGGRPTTVWDPAPGSDGLLGGRPPAGLPGNIAREILTKDITAASVSALRSLIQLLDTSRQTTRRTQASSTPLGLLVGQPIAILQTSLRLLVTGGEVSDATVYVGDPGDPEDGVLAWYRAKDLATANSIHPVLRLGVKNGEFHPYVAYEGCALKVPATGAVDGRSEDLLLLVVPGRSVTVTSGLLPRQRFTPKWDILLESIKNFVPNFRVGPVLVGANRMALPTPADLAWAWKDRLPGGWRDLPIQRPSGALPDAPLQVTSGWVTKGKES